MILAWSGLTQLLTEDGSGVLQSTLKTKKKLLPYLEAADLETSSQAASHQEEYLLATPEEEINPELIEFVKRDQFHDLFSEYALEHIDHFDNLCDSYGVFDFEKKMMLFSTSLAGPALDWAQHEPPLQSSHGSILEKLSWKGFARKPPFKSKYHHYSHQLERERDEEEWGGIPPHPEVLNEELIKHVERNPFYNSTSECAKEHLCNFEQLCHDYGLGDNPKKIQLFQLSLAGQAKEWAKFNAQHAFKTWNGYKGSFPHRFERESYQAARQTKIEDMLQEYLRNQEESTKKMERRIDFIHESLGNKSEVLFKQVIKLDEDIKKLREDHDRSLTLVKLDVASKYQELLNKSMRIEDTSYGNSKHLGSIYNRLQALEGSSHANLQEREESNTQPPSLLLQCHHKKKHYSSP
ncbi:unnamed protein product [Microthlaspi erraticum]|uniref:Retrotransposon gag domain-containing protein n=1 Tax=Microthlaspi erraticum TaxID=1685480 RepID=A0A6D2JMH5_9BRAS|nr:unnamed protein product [Microthlaspi erraticum]